MPVVGFEPMRVDWDSIVSRPWRGLLDGDDEEEEARAHRRAPAVPRRESNFDVAIDLCRMHVKEQLANEAAEARRLLLQEVPASHRGSTVEPRGGVATPSAWTATLPHPPVCGRHVWLTALSGWPCEPAMGRTIVDLTGISIRTDQGMPIKYRHHEGDWATIGWVTSVALNNNGLSAAGFLVKGHDFADDVSDQADRGHAWQCSIGATVRLSEFADPGEPLVINGRRVVGPMLVARLTDVHEISIVHAGEAGDAGASVTFGPTVRNKLDQLMYDWGYR
jgi:hypothetical protein